MTKYFCFLLLIFIHHLAFSQSITLTNRTSGKVLQLKAKKVEGLVTLDGVYFEGRPKFKNAQLTYDQQAISLTEIGILEVQKGSFKKVALFPLKIIGVTTGVAGALMTTAYVSDDEDEDPALGIAGLTLLGVGAGSLIVFQKSTPKSNEETLKSFHVKDWTFSNTK